MQFALLLPIIITTSLAEVLSIGALLPFLGVIAAPEKVFNSAAAQQVMPLLQLQSPQDLLLLITLVFVVAILASGIARTILFWTQTRLSIAISTDVTAKLYEDILHQPYNMHISRNSSEVIEGVRKAEALVHYIVNPVLVLLSSAIILIALVATLLFIEPFIAIGATLGFGFLYFVMMYFTKSQIERNGHTISVHQVRVTRAIQESLGGIRDVVIDGTQPVFLRAFRDALSPLQAARASNQFLSGSPRFGVEAIGITLIATLAFASIASLGEAGGAVQLIPALGALALGSQRLLPLLQQIYAAYTTLKGNQASTQDVINLLNKLMSVELPERKPKPLFFNTAISLKDLSFRYSSQEPWVLHHINLRIPKGSRVGFVGSTGSGKSTLFDVIMGLLTPTAGTLNIDSVEITPANSRAWQPHISHVPQAIYLSDASIAENIAFGVPQDQINIEHVKEAAQRAQIARTIENWTDGYNAIVGERGVKLSGGQRQRIGIARAFYKRAEVIILDEATSALDNETEAAVMQTVYNSSRAITLLIIAHRLSTLNNCDQIVELEHGSVKAVTKRIHMIRNTG